jgi:tripartite-type tricarboxylate transporter receptor subunit TctC
LNQKLVEALRSPDIRQRLSAQAFELWTGSPEEFSRVIRADHEKWGRIVRASGARVD